MPENVVLGLKGRALTVHPLKIPRDHKPIDAFFESMAGEIGDCAIGVVLSGGDDDGTLGAKAIVTRGGLTFAQEPGDGASSPQQPSMPESAIATGMINFILPVEAMGRRLAILARGGAAPKPRPAPDSTDAMSVICGIVLKQTNHDFSGYKRKSFQRRVARHMKFLGLKSESDYIARLSDNPTDVDCLFRDLLISVTSFFRDPLAFEAMARDVIPRLFDQKGPGEKVRVWVPGCATGQEVYSIAILLREYAESVPDAPRIQIFGTDIDEKALQVARAGRYPPCPDGYGVRRSPPPVFWRDRRRVPDLPRDPRRLRLRRTQRRPRSGLFPTRSDLLPKPADLLRRQVSTHRPSSLSPRVAEWRISAFGQVRIRQPTFRPVRAY